MRENKMFRTGNREFMPSNGNLDKLKILTEELLIRDEHLRNIENIYNNLNGGIWVIDKDGYTTYCNDQMAEILGYEKHEMLGKHLFEFCTDKWIEEAKKNLDRRERRIKEKHYFTFIDKNKEKIDTIVNTTPIYDDNQYYFGAIAIVTRLDEIKK
jgi:PAS domain S-box-containing protein